jgi:hypothetical protein
VADGDACFDGHLYAWAWTAVMQAKRAAFVSDLNIRQLGFNFLHLTP